MSFELTLGMELACDDKRIKNVSDVLVDATRVILTHA